MVQILFAVIMAGYKYGQTRDALAALSDAQWKEFQRMQESQLTELSVMLGRSTDMPYYEWFNILRSAQRLQRNGTSIPSPLPSDNSVPPPPKTAEWMWFAGGMALLILIISLRK